MTPEHDTLQELTAAYALGALTPEERVTFEAHLAGCTTCQAAVREFQPVLDSLARAVPGLEPPAALRERVLASVTGVPFQPPRSDAAMLDVPPPAASVRRGGLAPWLAAAAAVLLAALPAWWYTLEQRRTLRDLQQRVEQVSANGSAIDARLADLKRSSEEAQVRTAILTAPDLARVDLAGQKVSPDAHARAFWSRVRGLVFTAVNLPAPPVGKVYQLWVVTREAPISAGVLTPDPSGHVSAVIITPRDIPDPVAMAVTLEPEGGVPAPTGEKYLVGTPSAGS